MSEDKQFKIDIPESIEGYKVTFFWGLGLKQIVLVFAAILFLGLAVFNLATGSFAMMAVMLIMTTLMLLAIVEIRGRNFYRYILFIFSYYKNKPRVLVYNHYSGSGTALAQAKQLVFQKENHTKTFIIILISLILGLILLTLVGVYIYHVIHQ
jgi:polyferredoxin